MIIKNIELNNFTNYNSGEFIFSDNINILLGDNAQGKTNLLDAIFYLSLSSSNRNLRDRELIRWGEDSFNIKSTIKNDNGKENVVEVSYDKKHKILSINNFQVEKIKDYFGYLNSVIFSPDDLYLINGDPSIRRNYLDREILQCEGVYYQIITNYKKLIDERNSLLKKNISRNDCLLDVYDEKLIQYGTSILKRRLKIVESLKKFAKKSHFFLTDNVEDLDIKYDSKLPFQMILDGDIEGFKKEYLLGLVSRRDDDFLRGYTTLGPHRDDLKIYINGVNSKKYASQGQKRTSALSLKIAEINYLRKMTGNCPILLLDDVLSELDKKRKNKLFEIIEDKIQTFITTTDINDINESILEKSKIIEIRNGEEINENN